MANWDQNRRIRFLIAIIPTLFVVIVLALLRKPYGENDVSRTHAITTAHLNAPTSTIVPSTESILPLPSAPVPITSNPVGSAIAAPSTSVTAALQNVSWGVETSDGLAIWIGTFVDVPTLVIPSAKMVAKWITNPPLRLTNMAFSPDGQSLAVLTTQPFVGQEGDYPTWLYVIDLNTGTVQHLPDSSQAGLYQYAHIRARTRILGWLDNDNVAIQQGNEYAAVIAGKDGLSYARVSFPPQYSSAPETALSPDRTTFFSLAEGYWLYNTDGSNPRKIVDISTAKGLLYPTWSPDSRYIAFIAPVEGANGYDFINMSLWLLDLADNSQTLVSSDRVWGVTFPWSISGGKLAFLRTDTPISDPTARYDQSDKVNTNIFTLSTNNPNPQQLTSFIGAKNSGLQWTQGGNLIMSSTAGGTGNGQGIVAIGGANGAVTNLVSALAGETLVRPTLFTPEHEYAPGMPRVGADAP